MGTIEVPVRLFPPIEWFLPFIDGAIPVMNIGSRWNKRDKDTHRYSIADVNGRLDLTIPIEKPQSYNRAKLSDIRLSMHGDWWHVHRVALESGYGRTPFFEYYFPKFEIFFSKDTVKRYPYLWEYVLDTTNVIMELLQFKPTYKVGNGELKEGKFFRDNGKLENSYWQVRQDKLGFIGGLSVLDVLFNLGPEAALYIREIR